MSNAKDWHRRLGRVMGSLSADISRERTSVARLKEWSSELYDISNQMLAAAEKNEGKKP